MSDLYKVVVNHEEQYTLLPAKIRTPTGWKEVGRKGSRDQCLDHIEEVWTDMRPRNLRSRVEELARRIS